ncbi:hypothetical protein [Kitasatospora sp. NPDC093558]|uniref:hypothetical protein n=1 Tax=Kitasatospora sp. NPDC093558 TaxID=3155201 RepID=UPI00343F7D1C
MTIADIGIVQGLTESSRAFSGGGFPRNAQGFTDLLTAAGLNGATCEVLAWDHRADIDEWWSGPVGGVATIGRIVVRQPAEVQAEIRRQLGILSAEFTAPDGLLLLPHVALLAAGRA